MDAVAREKEAKERAKDELKAADIRFCDNMLYALMESLSVISQLRQGLDELKTSGLEPEFIDQLNYIMDNRHAVLSNHLLPLQTRKSNLEQAASPAMDFVTFHQRSSGALEAMCLHLNELADTVDLCYKAAKRRGGLSYLPPIQQMTCDSFCAHHVDTASKLKDIAHSAQASYGIAQKIIDLNTSPPSVEGR